MGSRNVTVPQCAAHVSASAYTAKAQATYDLTSINYYKTYLTSAQVLPGLIFGVLCWVVAVVFAIWLLTLCCRSVGWRSRRTRVHDVPAAGRNKWAVFNLFLFASMLGVVGTGTWALVAGLRSTDGSVDEFWGIVVSARGKLVEVSGTLQSSGTSIDSLSASVSASYTLVNNNQAVMTAFGVDVPATLSLLQSFESTLSSGAETTQRVSSSLQGNAIVTIEDFQRNYQAKTQNYWSLWRRLALAIFFGLLILFGLIAGVLALVDRTPRLTASSTLILWIWAGFVLLLGAGLLNLVWRISRDSCLYGVDYAGEKVGGGGETQVVLDYYFGRTQIAPADVSQRLFGVNLTSIIGTLDDPNVSTLIDRLQAPAGQILVSTASPSDRDAINALQLRVASLRGNLTSLNSQIQVDNFSGVVGAVKSLICCSTTTGLWNLWLASVITGAVAALLASLTLSKVVTAIHSIENNRHYTPHNPNGALISGKHGPP